MREIALDGIDGSGKTTVAELLKSQLEVDGQRVAIHRPYHEAASLLGQDLYDLWSSDEGALTAIETLEQTFDQARESAHANGTDVIIYDRHWMTAFTEIGDKPHLVSRWKEENFVATALLRVTPQIAAKRSSNDIDEAWMNRESLLRYDASYSALATIYGRHLLGIYRSDSDITPQRLAHSIAWDMQVQR